MKPLAVSTIALSLGNADLAQWPCDAGLQCGATIIHRDDSTYWVETLKNVEAGVGRENLDPLWDLFRCNDDYSASFVKHCPGRCVWTESAGQDKCEDE